MPRRSWRLTPLPPLATRVMSSPLTGLSFHLVCPPPVPTLPTMLISLYLSALGSCCPCHEGTVVSTYWPCCLTPQPRPHPPQPLPLLRYSINRTISGQDQVPAVQIQYMHCPQAVLSETVLYRECAALSPSRAIAASLFQVFTGCPAGPAPFMFPNKRYLGGLSSPALSSLCTTPSATCATTRAWFN